MQSLVGIAGTKATKGPTTAFGAFCGKKLKKENHGVVFVLTVSPVRHLTLLLGKDRGQMTTLPSFLKACSSKLRMEFSTLSHEEKGLLIVSHLEMKDEKENTLIRLSNVVISKTVDAKMQCITAMVCSHYCLVLILIFLQCDDLNCLYQTETLVLFCQGNLQHTYFCGSFATEGAQNWLENSNIGHTKLDLATLQMEVFVIAGCNKCVNTLKEGLYRCHIESNKTTHYCRHSKAHALESPK